MARRKQSYTFLTSIFALIIGLIIGFIGSIYFALPESYIIPKSVDAHSHTASVGNINADVINSNDLSIHFLELGNKYTGDCTLIKVGDIEILIDAGSKASSIPYITEYLDKFVENRKLEYVVVTHAHEDHYAGFATNEGTDSLFDLFTVENIIEFSNTNKSQTNKMYANYIRERDAEDNASANVYTALECVNETNGAQRNIELGNGIIMQILYHDFYVEDANTENEYSVCLQIINGDQKYLFTGDLEHEGEVSLVEHNSVGGKNENMLGQVELYKAGHHGSKTSSHNELLNIIKPKTVAVCCCAGSSEYTVKNENQFPTQEFVSRIYTANPNAKIYVTTLCLDYKANSFESFNGTIIFCAKKNGSTISNTLHFSNNSTELKDTDWFKTNRIMPS